MGWVNNVITVQALPQDRHISWPTHPSHHPPSSSPSSSPSGILPPILIPLTMRHPSLSSVCIRRSPGYTLSSWSVKILSSFPAIVFIDACATRLYARANLPCADRRSSINSLVQHTSETSRRIAETRTFGKMTTLYWFRESCFSRMFLFPLIFSSSFTPCHFFLREISFLPRFP